MQKTIGTTSGCQTKAKKHIVLSWDARHDAEHLRFLYHTQQAQILNTNNQQFTINFYNNL